MRYTTEVHFKILELSAQGKSSRNIAKELGISKSGVNNYLGKKPQDVNYNLLSQQQDKAPKLLLLDIETAPSKAVSFLRFKVNLSQDHIIKEGGWLLTYAYKWFGTNAIVSSKLTPEEAIASDDSRLVAELHDLVEQADFIVAHHGVGFDLPLLKTRVIVNKLPPMRKVRVIDTLQMVKEFKFNSNKLDSLCSALGLGRKIEHSGITLWVDCMNGVTEALNKMQEYNEGDIALLEELYLMVRPHSTRHPNLAIYYKGDAIRCNKCYSTNVVPNGNVDTTNLSIFEEYTCGDCKSRFKTRKSLISSEERKNVLSN